jgi:hypothetical protein
MMKLDVIDQAVIISSFGLFGSKAFAKQTALTPKMPREEINVSYNRCPPASPCY